MKKSRAKFFKYLKTAIYILTIVGIVLFVYFKRQELKPLLEIGLLPLLALLGVSIIPLFINALRFKNNISIFKIELPFKEWFGLTVSNTMYSFLLPLMSGLAVRAVYLKKKYDFQYSRQISFLTGSYLINFITASAVASLLSLWFYVSGETEFGLLYLAVGLVFICLLLLTFILFRVNAASLPQRNRFLSTLKSAAEGLHEFRGKPGKILTLVFLHILFIISLNIRLFIAFYILGIPVDFTHLLFIQSFVVFSVVLSITPGNIGLNEGIIGLFSGFLGISLEEALLGAILDRVVGMIVIFAFGLIYSKILLNNINLQKEESNGLSSS